MTATIGVLALQGDVARHLRALESVGARAVPVRRAGELDQLDGIVIPGGESTTIDKLSRIFELRQPLISALRSGLPAFGSCAGMIMLADRVTDRIPGQETFGGIDITVRRNAFGRQLDSFETELDLDLDHPLTPDLPTTIPEPGTTIPEPGTTIPEPRTTIPEPVEGPHPFHAVFIRAPWVEKAAAEVQVLATVAHPAAEGEPVIVAVRQGRMLATAFHPELTADTRLHAYFLQLVSTR